MYFKSRAEAGRKLAEDLKEYQHEKCSVVALSEGAVIVGAQIAMKFHAPLSILLTEPITLPGEPDPVAAISSGGTFTYNNLYSAGQLEEFTSEYHGYIEEQRLQKFHRLNQLVGHEGAIKQQLLKNRVVILVSDGLNNGFSLDVAQDFLKPVPLKRLIIATPFASVAAVDRMHLLADEILCLSVPEYYINTNHYYEDNTIPDQDGITQIIRNNSLTWATTK